MRYIKRIILILILVFPAPAGAYAAESEIPEESDQQINGFSLVGYGEKGKKSWDLAGKTADIFTEVVKLTDVDGNLYGKEEDVNLLADRGDFNKVDGKIHLEDNVVVTSTSGTKLTTDSLDYDRKRSLMTTEDIVNIDRENLKAVARGARGEPNLNKMTLKREVRLDITPATNQEKEPSADNEKIIITCDGPLEIDYKKNIAEFNKNVKVDRQDSQIYSDKMFVYFIPGKKGDEETTDGAGDGEKKGSETSLMTSKIDKIISRGNVKVVRGENTSYSDEAVYNAAQGKLILSGRPKLILYSTEEVGDAPFGG